ncbi:hypothetical protein [Flavobacterium sp. TBRC 19031]|uniref:hypothetical protein n=1 Tax=Flavobacterium mekongense TaxID=3379707 RepID=UPI00399B9863
MTKKITPYKQSLHSDDFTIIVEPTDFDPESQQILISLDNKVVEGVYNPITKNITAKFTSPTHKTYDVLEGEFVYNPLRIKVFAYDFEKERIVDAKLQEFLFNPQRLEYVPLDKLLTTSPMIISKWKKRLPNKIIESNNLTDNLEIDSKFYCTHCEEELTLELLKSTTGLNKLSSKQTLIINSILPFINLYRKSFGLDTCLKKAHFVAQIAHESKNFSTLEEDETYSSNITLGEFSKNSIEINKTILESLKDHLTDIFSITDSKDKELSKTSDEIKNILLDKKPKIIDGELYGYFL